MSKKLFWLPVVGLIFFSLCNLKKKNKKNKKFYDKLSQKNTEPKYPQNVAACECEFSLN